MHEENYAARRSESWQGTAVEVGRLVVSPNKRCKSLPVFWRVHNPTAPDCPSLRGLLLPCRLVFTNIVPLTFAPESHFA
jgi:hypothetical protein